MPVAASDKPPVSLIIPNFNGAELLRQNLPKVLLAADRYAGATTVIVVDDASSDESLTVLANEFPEIKVVSHPVNLGFAEAVHSGVNSAESEYLVFLNSDVIPEPDFLSPLICHFEADKASELFAVSPLVLEEDRRVSEVSWRCLRIRKMRLRTWPWPKENLHAPHLSLYASGGSMAVRKSLFSQLGGFQKIFAPFYSEDSDLGIRAWRLGFKTLLEPASRVVHAHAGSISENIARRKVNRVRVRNRFVLEWTHLPGRDLWLRLIPGYVVQAIGRLARFDRVYLGGLADALQRLPEILRLRKAINQSAKLEFWEVMSMIEKDLTRLKQP